MVNLGEQSEITFFYKNRVVGSTFAHVHTQSMETAFQRSNTMTVAEIKKETYWSRFADDFEERQRSITGKEVISSAQSELLKETNFGNVLELGCGTGLYTETLKDNAVHVVATDFSDEMIAAARKKRGGFQNVEFEKADALNLSYEDNRFDTVFMANLIHVIGDAERVVSESRRVLKTGGSIVITSFAIEEMSFFNRLSMGIRFLRTFGKPSKEATREDTSKEQIEAILARNGFDIATSKVLGDKAKATYIIARKK